MSLARLGHRVLYAGIYRLGRFFRPADKKLYFEYKYARSEDPWGYRDSTFEHRKYRDSVALLPRERYERVLEIGCSIGLFTRMLHERADAIDALDISQQAIQQARRECGDLEKVRFHLADLREFEPPEGEGSYDLVCAMEVLYYLADDEEMIRGVVARISSLLRPGGQLLYVRGSWEVGWSNSWEEYFPRFDPCFRLLVTHKLAFEERQYRISVLEKA